MTQTLRDVLREGISLAEFSTFKIGGPASYFARIQRLDHLKEALHFANERGLPVLVIGRGSNCLFDDSGFAGLVLFNDLRALTWETNSVTVEGGYPLARLAVQSAKRDLGGLEFACGIPGSVGGGIYMNAGAHGSCIGQVVAKVEWVDATGLCHSELGSNLAFSYRTSPFQTKGALIWRAQFALRRDTAAWGRCRDWTLARSQSQPWNERSAGCIFRNPNGMSAGALIEKLHLMGAHVGDAYVSQKHANYIVNCGNASSWQVSQLIDKVRAEVWKATSLHLRLEVLRVPYRPCQPGFWIPPKVES